MPIPDDFAAHLRRVDPDRWLAARFVEEAAARDELLALYALNDELARVGPSVREPMMGEMRLVWWGEAMEGLFEGRGGRGHPVLEALAPAIAAGRLPRASLDRMIDARTADLARAPFADEAALLRWLDGTHGALMSAAAMLLDRGAEGVETRGAGRACGWATLLRASDAWTAAGRRWTPGDWAPDMTSDALAAIVRTKVDEALTQAKAELKSLPVAAFPAVAYASLARAYARGRTPGDLAKRLRLLAATSLGRL